MRAGEDSSGAAGRQMAAEQPAGKQFHLISLGCAKNTVDSEAIQQLLLGRG